MHNYVTLVTLVKPKHELLIMSKVAIATLQHIIKFYNLVGSVANRHIRQAACVMCNSLGVRVPNECETLNEDKGLGLVHASATES